MKTFIAFLIFWLWPLFLRLIDLIAWFFVGHPVLGITWDHAHTVFMCSWSAGFLILAMFFLSVSSV
jgi:hypothetical protein